MSYRCLRFLNMSSLSDASKSLDPVKLQQVPASQHHPRTLFARESGPEFGHSMVSSRNHQLVKTAAVLLKFATLEQLSP